MDQRERESWWWKLVNVVEDHDVAPLSDAILRAYRSGELTIPERQRVERVLASSSTHRHRLIEMAGDTITQPPERIWRRLQARGGRTWRPYLVAAAVAAVLLVPLALLDWQGDDARLAEFDVAQFRVRVEGGSEVRSHAAEGEAYPGAVVKILVEPLTPAIDDLHFALYRLDGDRFSRVPEDRFLQFDQSRGAASIQVSVDHLVPPEAGDHMVYVVVTPDTDLPDRLTSDPGDASASLERATHGKVYGVPLKIHANDPGSVPPSEP